MGKSKKVDLVALIVFGVLVVSIIMAIVGVCIAWTSNPGLGDKVNTLTLSEWAELNSKAGKLDNTLEGFGVMQAFAYVTLVLVILTAIAFVVSKFVNVKALKWVVVAIAALTVISAIVAIATTYGFCGTEVKKALEYAPAAGAWLLTVFGILGGAAGVVGALKK